MNDIYSNLLMFVLVFIFVFLLQYNFFISPKIMKRKTNKKSKKESKKESKKVIEIEYLSTKFNIDEKKLMNRTVGMQISLINAFIISFISTLISNIPVEFYFQLLIGFILLMGLIYALYEFYGKYLSKKFEEEK